MTAITPVQNNSATSDDGILVIPLTTAATPGNFLLAGIGLPSGQSVASIVDNISGRWIQCSYATSDGGDVELWYSRGIQGGSASVTITTTAASVGISELYDSTDTYDSMDSYDGGYGGSVSANISEWSGVWYVDPLDQWTQNLGISASVTPQTVTPRTTGDLVITIGASSASAGAPTGPYTPLTLGGNYAMAYDVLSGSVASSTSMPTATGATWAAAEACFVAGPAGLNPLFQMPEFLVELSPSQNYQAAFQGTAAWTNITSFVRAMSLGPIARQHELDRVQASAATFTVNNRGGQFNSWNSDSFLYPGCLDPMTPVKVTAAAFDGTTHAMYWGYAQSFIPSIVDALNVDLAISAFDIMQEMSLAYLNNSNYAALVAADGGANLAAFYRLGDGIGSYSVLDSSGRGATGSLIAGANGTPVFGATAPFLYDASTALDCTASQNTLNGGTSTVDLSTQPPTYHQPLGGATEWTVELWAKWTSTSGVTPGILTTFSGTIGYETYGLNRIFVPSFTAAELAVGDGISGTNIVNGTVITAIGPINTITISPAATGDTDAGTFTATPGVVGSTLFSAASVPGVSGGVDVRAGAATAASVTAYNRVGAGTYVGGDYIIDGFSNGAIDVFDGAWHHIVVTYASDAASLWIDGTLDPNSPFTTGNWAHPANITFGCDAGPVNGWPGSLANVALYSSVLAADQIQNHYETGMYFQQAEFGAAQGDASAGRFNKVMAVAGLDPETMLEVPYPFKTLLYAETNPVTTTSGLNYLQTMSETEPGLIYQAPNGSMLALSRQYQYLSPRATVSQATFGDSASVSLHYDGPSFQLVQDDLDTWTSIQVQSGRNGAQLQAWSPTQSPALASSASVSGLRTLQGLTSLQFAYDSDALAVAQQYASWYGQPHQRVMSLMIDSYGSGGENIPQILGRQIYDRVSVSYQGQTPGPPFSQDALIEQITHSVNIANGPLWTTVYALSPYEILDTPFIFGSTTQSQLAGAASVSGATTAWVLHPAATNYASGTVTLTVAAGTEVVTYNATAAEVQAALVALVPGTTCSGGPINTSTVNVTFGASQSTFTAYFSPSNSLTL